MSQINKNIWIESIPAGYYDNIVRNSRLKEKGIHGFWHHYTFTSVNNYLKNSNNNFDYACGPGTFLGLYFKKKSVGYDISEAQINFAKKQYLNNHIFFTTKKDVIIKKGPFESITMLGLLEFLSENESILLLNSLYDQLESGGTIILTTPNYQNSMKLLLKLLDLFSDVKYSNITLNKLNKSKLIKLLGKTKFSNFEVIKSHNIFFVVSAISHKIAIKISNFFGSVTKNRFGFILIAILKK